MLKKLLILLCLTGLLNAEVATKDNIAKLYIATFDRAPDAAGLKYWLNSELSLEKIALSFFEQDEAQETYPEDTEDGKFVNDIFSNLFGRNADPAGAHYWKTQLSEGRMSRPLTILAIMNGSKGTDAQVMDNKLKVGLAFADDGKSDLEDAKAVLEGITKDKDSVNERLCLFDLTGCVTVSTGGGTVAATSITHNGTTYGFVTSPHTSKVWLDRNLGAAQVCTVFNDTACYGDYYQWGRDFDGHQDSMSSTTIKATDVNAAGSSFITAPGNPYDWSSTDSGGSQRSTNWSATDGTSVCPVGFRVPTIAELKSELFDGGSAEIQNSADAFNSFLVLPSAGIRSHITASLSNQGSQGYMWTSTIFSSSARSVRFSSGAATGDNIRAYGFTVRCLRD